MNNRCNWKKLHSSQNTETYGSRTVNKDLNRGWICLGDLRSEYVILRMIWRGEPIGFRRVWIVQIFVRELERLQMKSFSNEEDQK